MGSVRGAGIALNGGAADVGAALSENGPDCIQSNKQQAATMFGWGWPEWCGSALLCVCAARGGWVGLQDASLGLFFIIEPIP